MSDQYTENIPISTQERELTPMNKHLNILILEDMHADAELVQAELEKAGFDFTIKRVETKQNFLAELYNYKPDLILADFSLPQFSGLEALTLLKKYNSELPFIFFTEARSEETAVDCMKRGADDYILKSSLKRLPAAIQNALKTLEIKKEKKEKVEALKASEENYRRITENTRDLICTVDIEGNYLYLSPSYMDVLCYGSSQLLGTSWFSLIHEEDKNFASATWEKALNESRNSVIEVRYKHNDGSWKTFETILNWIYNDSARPFKAVLVSRDITYRKTAETELKKERDYISQIIEGTPVLVCGILPNGITTFINRSVELTTGYTATELIGKNWWDIFFPGEERAQVDTLSKMLREKQVNDHEVILTCKSGAKRVISWNSMNKYDKNGNISEIIGFGNDITSRKNIEEQIRLLANAVESTNEYISITDLHNKFTFVNNAFLTGYGYKMDEVLGKTPMLLDSPNNPEQLRKDIMDNTRIGGWKGELLNKRKDGTEFPIFLSTNEIYDDAGHIIGHIGVATDVTDRKKAEEKIKSSLKEKEIILKEIHHRVKNNLQVISSIFYLQSEKVNDKRLHDIIDECKNRVRSMAIIHENFYQSDDLTRIDFKEYLNDLINNLLISYGVNEDKIIVSLDVKDVLLSIDLAIPCGLLINELISNSIKHAFPNGRSGHIKVTMKSKNNKDYNLEIFDNGIGFPSKIDFKKTESLGMELVTTLTEQLEGTIELDSSGGTNFKIKFSA